MFRLVKSSIQNALPVLYVEFTSVEACTRRVSRLMNLSDQVLCSAAQFAQDGPANRESPRRGPSGWQSEFCGVTIRHRLHGAQVPFTTAIRRPGFETEPRWL